MAADETPEQVIARVAGLLDAAGIPYMLTGQLNQHPRPALAHMKTDEKEKIVKFYDNLLQEDS